MDAKLKWNRKYKDRLLIKESPTPNERLLTLSASLNGGNALDLACGLGGNSLFLARHGYRVEALDISDIAIDYLQEQTEKQRLSIYPRLADLTDHESLKLLENSFDLVVVTYYLDRSLFPLIKSILNDNGFFFMETFYHSPQNKQTVSDSYKLRPNELLTEFGDFHILYFEENEEEGRQTIFCRK
ncbi:class I SAM-dependent methyltransferase [Bacillus tuaregi]|uniref:class I SAM-dependent methyltransferase n=1 Tax=Bacillus tuaregi TaxID=1816695 RepID=UPI0008F8B9A5|nr:class I SAM-dependent methyltransferase [Bacillus tuaregi]